MGKPISTVKKWSDERKWEDDVEWIDFPDGKQILIRIVGDVMVLARHWIKTASRKKSFPQWCPQFDSDEEKFIESRPCPAHDDFDQKTQKVIIGNCIVRSVQERGDDNPVRGFLLPHAVNDDLSDIVNLIGGDPADPEKGVDLAVRYNSKAQGNKKWGIQRGNDSPLKDVEKAYDYFDFDNLCPNFSDDEVIAATAKSMKASMARSKYYVTQDQRIPEGARDPFKYFSGSEKGRPWTEFPELVAFRNEESDEGSKKHKVTKADDGVEESIDDEAPPPPAEDKLAEEKAESAKTEKAESAKTEKAESAKTEKAEPEKSKEEGKKASSNVHPDDDIGSKDHDTLGKVPDCFGKYDGESKCQRCPVRAKCIDEDEDDDL